jgi:hypothetical protein
MARAKSARPKYRHRRGIYGQYVQEKIKTSSADALFCSGSAAHNEQVMKKLVTKCALFAGKRLKPTDRLSLAIRASRSRAPAPPRITAAPPGALSTFKRG